MKINIERVSNAVFVLAMIFGVYVIGKIFIGKWRVPVGTCIISDNQKYILAAIILAVVSFILLLVSEKINKKNER